MGDLWVPEGDALGDEGMGANVREADTAFIGGVDVCPPF